MSKLDCMYGITKGFNIVEIRLCKCSKCQERGMWECFLDYMDGGYCDCIRLDELNEALIYSSISYDKALITQKKLCKQTERRIFIDTKKYKCGFDDGYMEGAADTEKRYEKAYKKVCRQLAEKTIAPKEYWEKWGMEDD